MRLADTHCHIDLPVFDPGRAEMLARARAAGVAHLVVIGFAPERWETGAALARSCSRISLAVGLHPTEAERFSDEMERRIEATAWAEEAVAIGETGLDYHWETARPEAQAVAFERQIYLAKRLGLPFIVHQRKAANDVLDILRRADPPHRGVMHCFTEGPEYAEQCLALGLHIGIGGAVTHRRATQLHEAARSIPADRLLLETDAPYMAPHPHRGERNEPAYLTLVVQRLAELRGVWPEEIAEQTTRNAESLFGLGSREGAAARTGRSAAP